MLLFWHVVHTSATFSYFLFILGALSGRSGGFARDCVDGVEGGGDAMGITIHGRRGPPWAARFLSCILICGAVAYISPIISLVVSDIMFFLTPSYLGSCTQGLMKTLVAKRARRGRERRGRRGGNRCARCSALPFMRPMPWAPPFVRPRPPPYPQPMPLLPTPNAGPWLDRCGARVCHGRRHHQHAAAWAHE